MKSNTQKSKRTVTGVQEAWNVTLTARRLGISRTTLQERMKRYGLRKP